VGDEEREHVALYLTLLKADAPSTITAYARFSTG